MNLKQYYLGCLAHASYLIADERTKTAAIVDPQRDVDQYLRDAEAGGCRMPKIVGSQLHWPSGRYSSAAN
jgi:hydroxyacylglutathione hydrolase